MLHFEGRKGKERRAQGTLLDERGFYDNECITNSTTGMKENLFNGFYMSELKRFPFRCYSFVHAGEKHPFFFLLSNVTVTLLVLPDRAVKFLEEEEEEEAGDEGDIVGPSGV